MTKHLRNIVAALTLLVGTCFTAAASELTISDGTVTSYYLPLYTYYWSVANKSQVLIPESMIADMKGTTITSIKFYSVRSGGELAETEFAFSAKTIESSYYDTSEFFDSSDATEVYSGKLSFEKFTTGREFSFDFTTPYKYEGGNLLLTFTNVKSTSSSTPALYFFGTTQSKSCGAVSKNGNKVSALQTFLPKMTFTYEAAQAPATFSVSADNLDFGKNVAGVAKTLDLTVTNDGNDAISGIASVAGGNGFAIVSGDTITSLANNDHHTITVSFNAPSIGEFTDNLTIDLGDAGKKVVTLTGSADSGVVTIHDSNKTSNCSPIMGYYWDRDNRSQVIIPASDLTALVGKTVTSITFYVQKSGKTTTESFTLSKALVDTTGFDSTTPAYLTPELTTIYSGACQFTSSTTPYEQKFTLTSPFKYEGGNLLLDFANTKGSASQTYFYGETVEEVYPTIYKRSSLAVTNFIPKTTFEFKNEIEAVNAASVNTSSVDFGSAILKEDTFSSTIVISNVGNTQLQGTVSLDNADHFTLPTSEIPALSPNEKYSLTVMYTPNAAGSHNATLTIDMGQGGKFEVALSGSAYSIPEGTRTVFNGTGYATALPTDFDAYALEILTESGDYSDSMLGYSNFSSTSSFSSKTVLKAPTLAWEHGNPMPSTDIYLRYYYLITPEVGDGAWFRAAATEVAAVGSYIKVYKYNPDVTEASAISTEELPVTWDTALSNTGWANATVSCEAGTRLAILMKFAAISTFVSFPGEKSAVSTIEKPVIKNGRYIISDLSGKVLFNGDASSFDAARASLNAGFYILATPEGTTKFVKK
jgi:hypothetical protein